MDHDGPYMRMLCLLSRSSNDLRPIVKEFGIQIMAQEFTIY